MKHVSLFHSVKPRLQEFYELEGLRAGNLVQPPHFEMRNPVASQICSLPRERSHVTLHSSQHPLRPALQQTPAAAPRATAVGHI